MSIRKPSAIDQIALVVHAQRPKANHSYLDGIKKSVGRFGTVRKRFQSLAGGDRDGVTALINSMPPDALLFPRLLDANSVAGEA